MAGSRALRTAVRALRSGDLGQSIVEVALTLPILAFTLLGAADMARAFSAQIAVQNAARAGAEALAVDTSLAPSTSTAVARAQDELGNTPGVSAGAATITVTFTLSDGSTACTGASSTSQAGTSSVATPCYANVNVRYTYSTLIPWPGLPHSFALDRTTTFRRYE